MNISSSCVLQDDGNYVMALAQWANCCLLTIDC